jgi:hypothetical protein
VKRRWLVALVATTVVTTAGMTPAYAQGHPRTVSVDGQVREPMHFSLTQLETALPQTTVRLGLGRRQVTDTGVLLETLVDNAEPAFPSSILNTKNELLRVTVTVRGAGHRDVTFAVGELDPNFGNHPALLALTVDNKPVPDGPELVVPGDHSPIRSVRRVRELTVGIATAPATRTTPPAGSPLEVVSGGRTVTLSASLLARLPSETLTVTFAGPGGSQTHTEIGPALEQVLAAARVRPGLNTWVAATGDDNYVATVTPAEQYAGGRPLQLALAEDGTVLAQPRLVTDGDIKGGRYVSGVVDLYTGTGPAR